MIIELNNVAIANESDSRVNQGRFLLTDVNLEINEGELVYLIGKVGSGKSTFIKALYGEVPIVHGDATIVGYDLRTVTRKQIPFMRRNMGIVLHDYPLLPDRNIYNNLKTVLLATSDMDSQQIHARVYEVLEIVGLTKVASRLPYELSSGEQQRITIARALLNSPGLIIADEPTANLDPETSLEITNLFVELSQMGCAVLISTHDVSIIEQNPARTLRCDGGTIEEIDIFSILGVEGPKRDVLSSLGDDYYYDNQENDVQEEYFQNDTY